MRFFDQMLQVAADETAQGRIVLAPFAVVAAEDQGGELKMMLDELHRRKIDIADRIIVVTDQTGYIGASTRSEMAYAVQTGKPCNVRHLPEPTPNAHPGDRSQPAQHATVLAEDLCAVAEQVEPTSIGPTDAEQAVLAAADRWAQRWLGAREIPPHMHARELVEAVEAWRGAR